MSKHIKRKTKQERRKWWYGLSDVEKDEWVTKWQARRERRRKKRPPKVQKKSRKYPWTNDGVFVDDGNREQWRQMVLSKNSWIDSSVFAGNSCKTG